MPKSSTCKLRPLARSGHCELWICGECGALTLHLGPMSLRLRADVLEEVVQSMQSGLRQLKTCGVSVGELKSASDYTH